MVTNASTPLGRLVPRHARRSVDEALADTRVVLVNGARQCGKSTLVRLAGTAGQAMWQTLDNESIRQAAEEDPAGFVDVDSPMVIDEIQRAPDLLLAIKEHR